MAKLKATVRATITVEIEDGEDNVAEALKCAEEQFSPVGKLPEMEVIHIQRLDADTTDADDA